MTLAKNKTKKIFLMGVLIVFLWIFPLIFNNSSANSSYMKGNNTANVSTIIPNSSAVSQIYSINSTWGGIDDDGFGKITMDSSNLKIS